MKDEGKHLENRNGKNESLTTGSQARNEGLR